MTEPPAAAAAPAPAPAPAAASEAKRQKRLEDEFECPILHAPMRDPVQASDGFTYERDAIERVLNGSPEPVSPHTGERFPNKDLRPNIALRSVMEAVGIVNLVPLSESGVVTEARATEHAASIRARSPTRESKCDWDKAEAYTRRIWREALHRADVNGDFFVCVNITNPEASDAKLKNGHFPKLGAGLDIRVSMAASMLVQCARESGFHATISGTASGQISKGFVACVTWEDCERARVAAQKYA